MLLRPKRRPTRLARLVRTLAAVGLVVAMHALPASAKQPGTPTNGRIVFAAGTTDLWTILPDGTDQQLLTSLPTSPSFSALVEFPSYSADGSRLAFFYRQIGTGTLCGAQPANCWSIVVMNADGTNRRVVYSGENVGSGLLALSPDGRRIAFTLVADDREPLFLIDDDGKHLTQLTTPIRFETNATPTWSPDGKRIAFETDRDCCAAGTWSIYIVDVHNRKLTKVMPVGGNDLEPDWSPDGKRLLFVRTFAFPDYRIFAVDVDRTHEQELVRDFSAAELPSWSPDGQKILYWRGIGAQLALADADGTNPHALLSGVTFGFAWRPA